MGTWWPPSPEIELCFATKALLVAFRLGRGQPRHHRRDHMPVRAAIHETARRPLAGHAVPVPQEMRGLLGKRATA